MRKNKYELTFELYYDNIHGHFYNFLVRYYNQNCKVYVDKNTVAETRLHTSEVAKLLKINPKPHRLIHYQSYKLVYLERLFYHAKHCMFHDSTHLTGRIYYQYFDSLKDMRADLWCKLVNMKTYIQTDTEYIETIEDL